METERAEEKLREACFAYSVTRLAKLKGEGTRLAHYTTAANGLNILRSKTVWLRNASVMNDFSEIAHGRACLTHAILHTEWGGRLGKALEAAHPGLYQVLLDELKSGTQRAAPHTYITSLAEMGHDEELGQLSMWRAYGGKAGVALVFSTSVLDLDTNILNAFHSPVLYADPSRFAEEFAR
jgi:hypothetical protein